MTLKAHSAFNKPLCWLHCFWSLLAPGLLIVASGCTLRWENSQGDTWTMGLRRHSLQAVCLNKTNTLATERSESGPLELALVPWGFEAAIGCRQQTRGVVIANTATNQLVNEELATAFLPGSPPERWAVGFFHSRIPRQGQQVRLVASVVKGGVLRSAANPYLLIGTARTTATTILADACALNVFYQFGGDFPNLQVQPAPSYR